MKNWHYYFFVLQILLFLAISAAVSVADNSTSANIKQIYATGELVEPQHKGKYIYPPAFAFDGDKTTIWAFHGMKSESSNIFIRIYFNDKVQIDEMQIVNGFAKDVRLYKNNNRIKKMLIDGNGLALKTGILNDNELNWQSIKLNSPVTTKYLSFELTDFYPGKYNDTCLADIKLLNKGNPIAFSNIQTLVNSQKEASLQKVKSANESFEKYFMILYTANNFFCTEDKTGIQYRFNGSQIVLSKTDMPSEYFEFTMNGNYLNLSRQGYYFQHAMKLHKY